MSLSKKIIFLAAGLGIVLYFQNCGLFNVNNQQVPSTPVESSVPLEAEVDNSNSPVISSEKYSETRVKHSCLEEVWAPDLEQLADPKKWQRDEPRIFYTENAPGDFKALGTIALEGVPGEYTAHFKRLDVMFSRKPLFARIEVSIFIPSDNGFNKANAKMPFGLWGGDPSEGLGFCGVNGCSPKDQTGFSVRLTRTKNSDQVPFIHGPRIYSYHLNRDGLIKDDGEGNIRHYGSGHSMGIDFPLDQWFKLVLDVGLNSFVGDDPLEDGFFDLYMYDSEENILGKIREDNIIFSKNSSWHFFGPRLTELWGGDPFASANIPLADTLSYYRDYKIHILQSQYSDSLSSCGQ